jgi:tetratricopeptide (TPR) repeat protein
LRHVRDVFAKLQEDFRKTPSPTMLISTLQSELSDVRAALDGALARSLFVDGAGLLADISASWRALGLEAEGIARADDFLVRLPPNQSSLRARLSIEASYLLEVSGEKLRALELAQFGVEQARISGDVALLARALRQSTQRAIGVHQIDEAERAYEEVAALHDPAMIQQTFLLAVGAALKRARGDFEAAARMFEQSLERHRALGDQHGTHTTIQNLAGVEHTLGRSKRAADLVRSILPDVRAASDKILLVNLLVNLVEYLIALKDVTGATAAALEALTLRCSQEPEHSQVALAIQQIGMIAVARGDFESAALLAGYAASALSMHTFVADDGESRIQEHIMSKLREHLEGEAFTRLTADGAELLPQAAIDLALEICHP